MASKVYLTTKNIILFILIVLFGCLSYYFILIGVDNIVEHSITYDSKSDIKYRVYLKDNSFFETPYLDMGKTYISSLIDYIDVDMNYNLKFDDLVSGKYTYYVNGTIIADKTNNSGRGSYWSKTYVISEPQTVSYDNQSGFSFITNVKIDYQKYNDLLKEFKNTYGLSIDGSFKVELIVKSESTNEILSDEVLVNSTASLNIPLTQQVLDLSIDLENEENKNTIIEEVKLNDFTHLIFLIIGGFQALISLMFLYFLFSNIRRKYLSLSEYTKTLSKILSTYDSIIVNVKDIPSYDGYNVIKVNSFSELIDAHSEVRMPINFCEVKKDVKSVFVLVNDKIVWEYVLENNQNKMKGRR